MIQNSFLTPNCPDPKLRANAQGIERVAVDDMQISGRETFHAGLQPADCDLCLTQGFALG